VPGVSRPVLSDAINCPVWSKVPQIELVSAQCSRVNIVLFAFMQLFVLNGRIVKSDAYSRACPVVAALLQLATDVWV
jgi:hypothetical protein